MITKPNAFKHGMIHTAEYNSWQNMKQRCYNKKNPLYKFYGKRGIKVCKRWRNSFKRFLKDMGLKPGSEYSIEREDNNGNYEPGNCCWATMPTQCKNRRNNQYITANGETLTRSDWARRLGCGPTTILNRINRGWSAKRAVTTPVRQFGEKK